MYTKYLRSINTNFLLFTFIILPFKLKIVRNNVTEFYSKVTEYRRTVTFKYCTKITVVVKLSLLLADYLSLFYERIIKNTLLHIFCRKSAKSTLVPVHFRITHGSARWRDIRAFQCFTAHCISAQNLIQHDNNRCRLIIIGIICSLLPSCRRRWKTKLPQKLFHL